MRFIHYGLNTANQMQLFTYKNWKKKMEKSRKIFHRKLQQNIAFYAAALDVNSLASQA